MKTMIILAALAVTGPAFAAGEDGPAILNPKPAYPACPLPPGTRGTCVNPDGTLSVRR